MSIVWRAGKCGQAAIDVNANPLHVKPIVLRVGTLGQAVASHVQANTLDDIKIVEKHIGPFGISFTWRSRSLPVALEEWI